MADYVTTAPMEEFVVGDLDPLLTVTLKDRKTKQPVDLTGYTVTFWMKAAANTKALKVDYVAMVVDPDQVLNKGQATYTWLSGNVDLRGSMKCRVRREKAGRRQHSRIFYLKFVDPDDHPRDET